MSKLFNKILNQYHYALESIKNRYPCKIVEIKNLQDFDKATEIQYQAATKINIRSSTVRHLLEDPLLVEKFHPTDGVKLGFLAFGEILLKEGITMEKSRDLYLKIAKNMLEDSRVC